MRCAQRTPAACLLSQVVRTSMPPPVCSPLTAVATDVSSTDQAPVQASASTMSAAWRSRALPRLHLQPVVQMQARSPGCSRLWGAGARRRRIPASSVPQTSALRRAVAKRPALTPTSLCQVKSLIVATELRSIRCQVQSALMEHALLICAAGHSSRRAKTPAKLQACKRLIVMGWF